MAAMVYILGALTSLACAVLLLRGYCCGADYALQVSPCRISWFLLTSFSCRLKIFIYGGLRPRESRWRCYCTD